MAVAIGGVVNGSSDIAMNARGAMLGAVTMSIAVTGAMTTMVDGMGATETVKSAVKSGTATDGRRAS